MQDNVKDSETVVYLGDDEPVVVKPTVRSRGNSESKVKQKQSQDKGTYRGFTYLIQLCSF